MKLTIKHKSLLADALSKVSFQAGYTSILIYSFSRSTKVSELGIISIAMMIPSLFFVFFSKNIIFKLLPLRSFKISMILRSFIFLLIPLLPNNLLLISLMSGLAGLFQQVAQSSKLIFDTSIVPREDRTKFNATRAFWGSIAVMTGPALAGGISGILNPESSIFVTSILSILSIIFLFNIIDDRKFYEIESEDNNKKQEVVSNVVVLKELSRRQDLIIPVIVYVIVLAILEMEAPLVFPFVKEVYGKGGDVAGTLLGVCGVGGLVSSMMIYKVNKAISSWVLTLLLAFDGIILALTTNNVSLEFLYLLYGLLGIIASATLITVETKIQNEAPKKYQPFLFSSLAFASGAGGACLTLVSTFCADLWGAAIVLRYCAYFEMIIGVSATLFLIMKKKGK